jgi:hypothetical protein
MAGRKTEKKAAMDFHFIQGRETHFPELAARQVLIMTGFLLRPIASLPSIKNRSAARFGLWQFCVSVV